MGDIDGCTLGKISADNFFHDLYLKAFEEDPGVSFYNNTWFKNMTKYFIFRHIHLNDTMSLIATLEQNQYKYFCPLQSFLQNKPYRLDKFKKNIIVCIISLLSALSQYIPGSNETAALNNEEFNKKIENFVSVNDKLIETLIQNNLITLDNIDSSLVILVLFEKEYNSILDCDKEELKKQIGKIKKKYNNIELIDTFTEQDLTEEIICQQQVFKTYIQFLFQLTEPEQGIAVKGGFQRNLRFDDFNLKKIFSDITTKYLHSDDNNTLTKIIDKKLKILDNAIIRF